MTPHDPAAPDDVTAAWWAATREHRLVLQRCAGCGRVQHPPRALCAGCGSMAHLGWVDAAGAAEVDACTVVERAPAPGNVAPYVVARVRLPEGPVLLSNVVDTDPYTVAIGDAVRVAWRDLPDGRALPVFVPVSGPDENKE